MKTKKENIVMFDGLFMPATYMLIALNCITTSHFGAYEIILFESNKIVVTLKEVNSSKRTLRLAKAIAKGLKVKLLDATTKPPIFIEIY